MDILVRVSYNVQINHFYKHLQRVAAFGLIPLFILDCNPNN